MQKDRCQEKGDLTDKESGQHSKEDPGHPSKLPG